MYLDYKKKILGEIGSLINVDIPFRLLDENKCGEKDFKIHIGALKRVCEFTGSDEEFLEKIKPLFSLKTNLIEEVALDRHYITFLMNKRNIANDVLVEVLSNENFSRKEKNGKRVVIDYSSPNIAKPFHAGHLRTTILGSYLANLHEHLGYEVVRINYLGDWGAQFGLVLLGFEKYGKEEDLKKDAIKHLYNVYVKINSEKTEEDALRAKEIFCEMQNGNENYLNKWRIFREASIELYKKVYAKFRIVFDEYSGESFYRDCLDFVIPKLRERNILVDDKGTLLVDLTEYGLERAKMMNTDGSALYLTRDIMAVYDRKKRFSPDHLLYVIASQQTLHMQQLNKITELLDPVPGIEHVSFGMVRGMSTRHGTAVFLDDILEKAKEVIRTKSVEGGILNDFTEEERESIIERLAVSTIVVQDFYAKKIKDYDFDMTRNTRFEGNTGPYIQYTHCRICSILRRAEAQELRPEIVLLDTVDDAMLQVCIMVAKFNDVLDESLSVREPSVLVHYVFELCALVNNAYANYPILSVEPYLGRQRLAVFYAAKRVLATSLIIMGVEPIEYM